MVRRRSGTRFGLSIALILFGATSSGCALVSTESTGECKPPQETSPWDDDQPEPIKELQVESCKDPESPLADGAASRLLSLRFVCADGGNDCVPSAVDGKPPIQIFQFRVDMGSQSVQPKTLGDTNILLRGISTDVDAVFAPYDDSILEYGSTSKVGMGQEAPFATEKSSLWLTSPDLKTPIGAVNLGECIDIQATFAGLTLDANLHADIENTTPNAGDWPGGEIKQIEYPPGSGHMILTIAGSDGATRHGIAFIQVAGRYYAWPPGGTAKAYRNNSVD